MGRNAKIKLIRAAVASGDQEVCRDLVRHLAKRGYKFRGRVVDRALLALPEAGENVNPDAERWTRAVKIVLQQQAVSARDGADEKGRP